jgi:hypothetical protein
VAVKPEGIEGGEVSVEGSRTDSRLEFPPQPETPMANANAVNQTDTTDLALIIVVLALMYDAKGQKRQT